jgi:K+-transporting ATPase ATPase A chain
MTFNSLIHISLFFAVVVLLTKPLGSYMARVYEGHWTPLTRLIAPIERLMYRMCGLHGEEEMGWKRYASALLVFSAMGMVALYVLQRCQPF